MTHKYRNSAGYADAVMADNTLQPQRDRPTVLIVDDDSTARLALAAIVGPDDYHVQFATSATELCARMPLLDPDVVICDLVMEDMCGDELFRWMQNHERWRFVPIIGVTRMDSAVVRADLLDAGADVVLAKPCSAQELRAYVRAAVRTRRKFVLPVPRRNQGIIEYQVTASG